MTLRARLFLLVGGAVALTVTLVTVTVSNSARRAFEALDRQRTGALVSQFRQEVARQRGDVANRVDMLVASDGLQRVLADIARQATDYSPFVGEAGSLAAAHALDVLDLVAADGTIISSAEWPARFGYQSSWMTARIGRHDTPAFLQPIELPSDTALGLIAIRTVTVAGRSFAVVGGRTLDQQFLGSLSAPAGIRVLLYRNVEPEVARLQLVDASGHVPDASQFEPLISRVRQAGVEATELVASVDGPLSVDAIPLAGLDGKVLGVLLVASSERDLVALISRIRWSGAGFGAMGILAGLALGYVLARRVTRPVERLSHAAGQVAGGDWSVRVDDTSASGEIGALQRAFNTMTNQLAEQRDRLVQAERVAAWRELASRLAHELKNPLFPLRLTVDNLRRARGLPSGEFVEVLDESLTTLDTGLRNLNTVVGRFRDFAKMPAPEFGDTSPNDLVRRTLGLFKAQIDAADPPIAVTLDLDPAAGSIIADAEQLGRAIQNLVLNAIDAMPHGGTLTVRTSRAGSSFQIEVADTGAGLTAEERARLFTPYYTTKQQGTGLGLAIVQAVVADHRGAVHVDSTPGAGTRFRIELPTVSGAST